MLVSRHPSTFRHSALLGWTFQPMDLGASSPTLITTTDDQFVWTVDVPGVAEDHLDLEVQGREIRLTAERKSGESSQRKDYLWRLPRGANPETLSAQLENGVLTFTVSKHASEKARKVPIGTESAA